MTKRFSIIYTNGEQEVEIEYETFEEAESAKQNLQDEGYEVSEIQTLRK